MSIIKSFSVGEGDMFYIRHNGDNFTIIDCCMRDDDKEEIVAELKNESKSKGITRFISTHPDDDHIANLKYLDGQMPIVNFYCVNNDATKKAGCGTVDFDHYCELRKSSKAYYLQEGCQRKWLNQSDNERYGSGISVKWPITGNADFKKALECAANGESPNNISPIFTYSIEDGAELIWMGDLENGFQEKIKNAITLPSVDILFAPHHGRDTGKVVKEWLKQLSPSLIVVGEAPSEHLCYYPGYNCITQNSAGAITFDCEGTKIHIYVSKKDYSVTFLSNEQKPNAYGGKYLGTLEAKAATKPKAAAAGR